MASGSCLTVQDHGTQDGALLVLAACTGGSSRHWTVRGDGEVVQAATGKCLDAKDGGTANSTALVIAACTGAGNQRWNRA